MIAVYDKLIYFNEASKYTILRMRTDDPSVPEEARSSYTFRDRMLRFTAVGYGLPQTDSVKLELEGDWKEGKYGLQLHVEHWHELVPPTTEGLLSYLSSGLLKGIGESTAKSIVLRFGTDTLDVLEYHPEKLLEIRGITEQKLEEIKTCYAESRAMRDIMELLTPFQVTPVTALKIYQHFGPACTDILRKSPFRLCEISGFGFRRVDTIIRKSGGDPHDPVRIHGAMICALENAPAAWASVSGGQYADYRISAISQRADPAAPNAGQACGGRAEIAADGRRQRDCFRRWSAVSSAYFYAGGRDCGKGGSHAHGTHGKN